MPCSSRFLRSSSYRNSESSLPTTPRRASSSSRDPQKRFVDRADDYARFRPSYPAEIIAAVLDGYAVPRVADIGAGTGISSRLLAEAGARVIAIEPNAAMRGAIEPSDAVAVVDGNAEATGLAD